MQKLILFLFIVLVSVSNSFAQCPTAGFTLPNDTLCDFTFTNTSSAGSYQWDFCSGDLKTTPTGSNLGNIGGLFNPSSVKVVYDQGHYYAFIANLHANNVLRYDFGNSLDNPNPDTLAYPNFSLAYGIDVVKDGNNWYALVVQYSPATLIKMELGPNISDDTTHNTDLGGFGFNGARCVKIVKDNSNYYAFVTNQFGNGINKIEFGNSLANPVSNSSVLTDPAFAEAWGFDMAYSCDLNKYVGFVANFAANNITVVDYGNSLTNPGSVLQSLTTPDYYPTGLNIVRDGEDWSLIMVTQNLDKLNQLILGNNLLNPAPTIGFVDTIGGINDARGLSMINDSSRWHGIIANQGMWSVTVFKFEDSCSASVLISNDTIPQNVFYEGSGWQHISISVTNSNGFVNVFTDSVYTVPRPSVNFSFGAGCLGQPVSFTDLSTIGQGSIASWQWDFGDGSGVSSVQNPTYPYTIDSTYLVTLIATSDAGCAGSFSDSISIHDFPSADFSYLTNQCSETPLQFTDLSTTAAGDSVVSWIWDFGDGSPIDNAQNPIHSFDSSGPFSVQLIAFGSSGCTDTISHSITIKPRPVISFTASQTCIGETTLFSNGTTISDTSSLSYDWAFGDGNTSTSTNPTNLYPLISFTYSVQLIANSTNLCADTLLQNVRISSRANPGFIITPSVVCLNNTVQFIDTSTIANGDTIALLTWDFGDGSAPAYGDTVSHIYTLAGSDTVMLTVTSLTSCDTFITKTVTVLESPTANFTFTNVCENAPMYFYDSSFTPVGSTIDSIIWDFGDGTAQAFGDTVIHGYIAPGTYNVTETVINNFGCYGTITQQVTVYALPVASFTNTIPACTGNAVNFTNTSTVQNDSITVFNWDFGDGTGTSALPDPTYIYNGAQTYSVSLIVTSSHGCQATITQPVTVYPSPLFNFTDSLFCLDDTTHFTYVPLNSVPVAGWLWDFGDFITSILPNPGHHYITAGSYNACLTVTALNGCSNTVCQTVTINPKPSAGILSDSVICIGTTITFTDNSSINSGAIIQWLWNFGDGTPPDVTQNTSHLYGNDSTYIVTHTVVSDAGCIDNVNATIEVEPLPVASFIPDPTFGSPPLIVQFLNTSSGAVTYQWTFGDGGSDFGTSPTHTYTDTGYYQVTLIATNSFLCSDTAYNDISVLIPYLDLGIKEVHATKLNDLLSLSADLANLGNIAINKFQISAKTETGSPINEQWSSNVLFKPGESYTYNFTARYEIDPLNVPSFYCIEISEINGTDDAVESNNKKCAAINEEFQLFDIFPNPSSGDVTIGMNVPLDGSVDVTIYNSIGQLMKLDAEIPVSKGYNEFKYSIRSFAKGFYAFTVQFRDNIQVKRVIKK